MQEEFGKHLLQKVVNIRLNFLIQIWKIELKKHFLSIWQMVVEYVFFLNKSLCYYVTCQKTQFVESLHETELDLFDEIWSAVFRYLHQMTYQDFVQWQTKKLEQKVNWIELIIKNHFFLLDLEWLKWKMFVGNSFCLFNLLIECWNFLQF